MFESHVVEIAGRVAGAAVGTAAGLRFMAIDPRLEEIDGSVWRSLADLHRAAGHLLRHGSLPGRGEAPPPTARPGTPAAPPSRRQ
jgi:hypothetical protein